MRISEKVKPFIILVLVLSFVQGVCGADQILVLHFDEGSGTIAHDSSGNGYDGTIFGATWVDGISGKGLLFDGNDYIQFSSPVTDIAPFTVIAWVKTSSIAPSSNRYILANGGETQYGKGFTLLQDTNLGWNFCAKDKDVWGVPSYKNTSSDWTQLVGIWDGTHSVNSTKLYVNGKLADEETPFNYSRSVSSRNLRIGAPTTNTAMFKGIIDEVEIYPRALSPDEILSDYYSKYILMDDSQALILHFDEGSGTIAHDSSGNGYDGTVNGATWVNGISGQALQTDGSDDWIDLGSPALLNLRNAFTFEAWVKTDETRNDRHIITRGDGRSFATAHYFFGLDGGYCNIRTENGTSPSGWVQTNSKTQIADSQWHYCVATFDGSVQKIFIDGKEESSAPQKSPLNSISSPVWIAKNYQTYYPPFYFFRGALDEIQIHNRALSSNEILANYNSIVKNRPLVLNVKYKNTLLINEGTKIDIHVTDGFQPVSAYLILKVNGEVVDTYTGSDYQYNFLPPQAGTYQFEVIARKGAEEKRYVGSIEVIGKETPALVLADDLVLDAYAEIFQAEDLAADKTVKSTEEIALHITVSWFVNNYIKGVIGDFIYELSKNGLPPGTIIIHISEFADVYSQTAVEQTKMTLKKAISLGFPSAEDAVKNFVRNTIDALLGNGYRITIDQQYLGFRAFVQSRPDLFSSLSPKEIRLFSREYIQPVSNVVETYHPIIDVVFMGYHLPNTMQDVGNFHLWIGKSKDAITVGIFIIGFLIGIALLLIAIFVPASLAAFIPIALSSTSFLWGALTKITVSSIVLRGFLAFWLMISLLCVVPHIAYLHGDGIENIKCAVDGSYCTSQVSMDFRALSLDVSDTWEYSPATITSTGQVFVLTPDGRITSIFQGSGLYTPYKQGTYRVIAYQHNGHPFSAVTTSEFEATRPNVTLATSYILAGNQAIITLNAMNNEDLTVDSLSVLIAVENSTNSLVYMNGELLSLAPGEERNVSFTVDLAAPDIYTSTAAIIYKNGDTLDEEKFPITYQFTSVEDAAIIRLEYEPVYSPMANVTMNLTLQSYQPDLAFNISLPSIGFSKPVVLTGTKTVLLTLPVLPPESYFVPVIIEKDNRTLDSRIINFYVQAEGVGVLTFNVSQLLLTTGKPVILPLTVEELTMVPLSAAVNVTIIDPNGTESLYTAIPRGDEYTVSFTPTINGTYLAKGHAEKAGYRMIDDQITLISGEMSRLNMTIHINETVIVRVYGNGRPAACKITMQTDDSSLSTFASDGLATFNVSDRFTIRAEKMFYEPAYFEMPDANFSAAPQSGPTPLRVEFTDTSSSHIDNWYWEFGDGTTSTSRHPYHWYKTPGNYQVNLTVNGSQIKDTESKAHYIIVFNGNVIPLPGYTNPPTDPDSDGIYEDLNANGRLDFADIVLYFNYMQWIAANEPIAAFDLNGNGRIDFADIVTLFNEI